MQTRILIADGDIELVERLRGVFESEGFRVSVAHTGRRALDAARAPSLDVAVLGVTMPEMNGLDVLKDIRKRRRMPVIMLAPRGDDLDRILGLELGADDVLPKPCEPRELLARIRGVLRWAGGQGAQSVLRIDDLELDQRDRTVLKNGEPVELTGMEFRILQTLMQHAGQVVNRRELYLSALGRRPVAYDRSVDMHVSNLRRKLGTTDKGKNRIEAVRGVGYQYRVR